MSLPSLMSLADFWTRLPIEALTFDLTEPVETSRDGSGAQLRHELGEELWTGEVRLGAMSPAEAADITTLLQHLRRAGRAFLAADSRRPAPTAGAAPLAGAAPVIAALGDHGTSLAVSGLPAGYTLARGDYLGFPYLDPARHALHRVAETVTAAADGTTDPFEVVPYLRPGAVEGAPVDLVLPSCRAVIVVGSSEPGGGRGPVTRGQTFRFIQSLRST